MIFGEKPINSMIITLVDEKDRVASEYKIDVSNLGMVAEDLEAFIETFFKGNWLE